MSEEAQVNAEVAPTLERQRWRRSREWVLDIVWPTLRRPDAATRAKRDRDRDSVVARDKKAVEVFTVGTDLATFISFCESLLKTEEERKRSADGRLMSVLGLTSLLATIAFGFFATTRDKLLGSAWYWNVAIVTVAVYVLVQLMLGTTAALGLGGRAKPASDGRLKTGQRS